MLCNAKKRSFNGERIVLRGSMTYSQIAKILGVSADRVRQIENEALCKLMHPKNMRAWQEIIDAVNELRKMRDERLRGAEWWDTKI